MAAKDTTASQGPPLRFSQKLLSRKMSFALVVGVFLFYVIGIFVRSSQGIRLVLHNESGAILKNATIRFENEKQYSLGEIAPGKTRKSFVISDSNRTSDWILQIPMAIYILRLWQDVENGYCGDVKVQILPALRIQSLDKSFGMNWQSWFGFLN
jgi:hypothetical protein